MLRLIAITILATACSTNQPTYQLLAPDPTHDLVHAEDSEASLRERFGAEQVRASRVIIKDTYSLPGTTLFPDDSSRRIEIVWRDSVARKEAAFLYVREKSSRWQLHPGITIGSTLHAVDSINGKSFLLRGSSAPQFATSSAFLSGHLDTLWHHAEILGATTVLSFDRTVGITDSLPDTKREGKAFTSDELEARRLGLEVREIMIRPRSVSSAPSAALVISDSVPMDSCLMLDKEYRVQDRSDTLTWGTTVPKMSEGDWLKTVSIDEPRYTMRMPSGAFGILAKFPGCRFGCDLSISFDSLRQGDDFLQRIYRRNLECSDEELLEQNPFLGCDGPPLLFRAGKEIAAVQTGTCGDCFSHVITIPHGRAVAMLGIARDDREDWAPGLMCRMIRTALTFRWKEEKP